jgi:chromosome partitioning protein
MKGGVGKSTLAVNLAWQFGAMRRWSKKVLLVDLDPQFNASQYLLGSRRYEAEIHRINSPTVWNIFERFTRNPRMLDEVPLDHNSVIHNVSRYQSGGEIDLIPSRLELADTLRHPAQKEGLLEMFISEVEEGYDLILLDCPPTESLFTTAAYLASDYLLVPVKPEFLSTIGLQLLARSMSDFHDEFRGEQIQLAGIAFNATSEYSPEEMLSKRSVQQLANQHDWYVFDNEIRYSRSYPKGAREGRPIFGTSYARTNRAREFHSFAVEFSKRVGL